MFFKIMFEGIKVVTTPDCDWDFVQKGWTNITQTDRY